MVHILSNNLLHTKMKYDKLVNHNKYVIHIKIHFVIHIKKYAIIYFIDFNHVESYHHIL